MAGPQGDSGCMGICGDWTLRATVTNNSKGPSAWLTGRRAAVTSRATCHHRDMLNWTGGWASIICSTNCWHWTIVPRQREPQREMAEHGSALGLLYDPGQKAMLKQAIGRRLSLTPVSANFGLTECGLENKDTWFFLHPMPGTILGTRDKSRSCRAYWERLAEKGNKQSWMTKCPELLSFSTPALPQCPTHQRL